MKGEETAIPFTTYMILTIIVAFIALMIVTQGRISILFSANQLEGLFEPNKFTACALNEKGNQCIAGQKVSGENVVLDCDSIITGNYIVDITKVGFLYKSPPDSRLGNRFEFIVVLDYADQLITGKKNDGTFVFACNRLDSDEYECEKFTMDNPLKFTILNARGDRFLLHLTAWKNEPSVVQLASQQGTTFAKLLDEEYPNYITSVDIPVKVIDTVTCSQNVQPSSAYLTCRECTYSGYIWCSEFSGAAGSGRCVDWDDKSKSVSSYCNLDPDHFWANIKGMC